MSSNEPEGNSSRASKVGKSYLMIRTCVMSITHFSKSNSNKRVLLSITQVQIMVIITNKNTLKEI